MTNIQFQWQQGLAFVLLVACTSIEEGVEGHVEGVIQQEVPTSVGRSQMEASLLWSERVGSKEVPLTNLPVLTSSKRLGKFGLIEVTIRNEGKTVLAYSGYSPSSPRQFQEILVEGKWEKGEWDWCGTGMENFRIEPGESRLLQVHFLAAVPLQRILVGFREEETSRYSHLVLVNQIPGESD